MIDRTRYLELVGHPEQWDRFRKDQPRVRPDLSDQAYPERQRFEGDFAEVDFARATLGKADFTLANLRGANFSSAKLHEATLGYGSELHESDRAALSRANCTFRGSGMSRARMQHADFTNADFTGADLRGARMDGAVLVGADFSGALLEAASFENADLTRTVFSGSQLWRANFENATIGWTIFDNVDLSDAFRNGIDQTKQFAGRRGGPVHLETVKHAGPSSISLSTLYRTSGNGVPKRFLLRAQPDIPTEFLSAAVDAVRKDGPRYYSAFVSYSHVDAPFARKLHRSLKARGVQCFIDQVAIEPGTNWRGQIAAHLNRYDRFLIVLSQHSIRSPEVRWEIATLQENEPYAQIIPLSLDAAAFESAEDWVERLRLVEFGRFEQWQDPLEFKRAFKHLLDALRWS